MLPSWSCQFLDAKGLLYYLKQLNPLSPDLYTFLTEQVRRICLNIKTSYPWWSLPLFLSFESSNKQWSCKEKFHFHQGLGLKGLTQLEAFFICKDVFCRIQQLNFHPQNSVVLWSRKCYVVLRSVLQPISALCAALWFISYDSFVLILS